MKVQIAVTMGLAAILAACSPGPSAPKFANGKDEVANQIHAQILVEKRLREPASAQYGSLAVADIGLKTVVCGDVNAKNGFGGYTGPKRFIAMDERAVFAADLSAEEFAKLWAANCPP